MIAAEPTTPAAPVGVLQVLAPGANVFMGRGSRLFQRAVSVAWVPSRREAAGGGSRDNARRLLVGVSVELPIVMR